MRGGETGLCNQSAIVESLIEVVAEFFFFFLGRFTLAFPSFSFRDERRQRRWRSWCVLACFLFPTGSFHLFSVHAPVPAHDAQSGAARRGQEALCKNQRANERGWLLSRRKKTQIDCQGTILTSLSFSLLSLSFPPKYRPPSPSRPTQRQSSFFLAGVNEGEKRGRWT